MNVKFLSSKDYPNSNDNCGDCIIIYNNGNMIVYDCGCIEHAERVIDEMTRLNINKITGVLSHNDSDHFDGFLKLIEEDKVECIYTICALKHIDDIIEAINDNRHTRDGIKKKILAKFDNINQLSGYLKDIYDSDNKLISTEILPGVSIVCPEYHYAIETIARAVKNTEPDTKDGDSVMNAASVCLKIEYNNRIMLLTGDSTFENIKSNLDGIDYIQLPHHGRESQLKDIVNYYDNSNTEVTYLISDNTGNSNGGFDGRHLQYRSYKVTRMDGDFEIKFDERKYCKSGILGDIKNAMFY